MVPPASSTAVAEADDAGTARHHEGNSKRSRRKREAEEVRTLALGSWAHPKNCRCGAGAVTNSFQHIPQESTPAQHRKRTIGEMILRLTMQPDRDALTGRLQLRTAVAFGVESQAAISCRPRVKRPRPEALGRGEEQ